MNQEVNLFSAQFYEEVEEELYAIEKYWTNYSVDHKLGGFFGRRDHHNNMVPEANKGIVLNTRILWSFSALAEYTGNTQSITLAKRAFKYLQDSFKDQKHKGVYWEVNAYGKPVNRKKQVYAQAFTIYALVQYYTLVKDKEAKSWAIKLFKLLENRARDDEKQGYIEAFKEDWSTIEDMRLSDKDYQAEKTMNTHLHVLEAYTLLYTVYPDTNLKKALQELIRLFLDRFLSENNHFYLFFDRDWNVLDKTISYGHDIEAAWLLVEAARAIEDQELLKQTNKAALGIAKTFLKEGYEQGKGVRNEYKPATQIMDTDRHWWPQAEAMLGLLYAHSIAPQADFKAAVLNLWDFIKAYVIDHTNGEWFFRIDKFNKPYTLENKIGFWKCPYHNSRALLSILKNFR